MKYLGDKWRLRFRWTVYVGAWCYVLLIPVRSAACGFDPCSELSVGLAHSADSSVLLHHYHGLSKNLHLLLVAYYGKAVEEVAKHSADDVALATYDTPGFTKYVEQFFTSRGLVVPKLDPEQRFKGWPQGVCSANVPGGTLRFLNGLDTAKELKEHYGALFALRYRLTNGCPGASAAEVEKYISDLEAFSAKVHQAKEFTNYLHASVLFYTGDFTRAIEHFEHLNTAKNAWLKETAIYMKARVQLIASQKNWSGWSPTSGGIDQEMLSASESSFRQYLDQFPNGLYDASARGIFRRISWLRSDQTTANRLIRENLERAVATKNFAEIVNVSVSEIDYFYDPTAKDSNAIPFSSPLLAASIILSKIDTQTASNLERLEAARASYSEYPGLFNTMRMTILLNLQRPKDVVQTPLDEGVPKQIQWTQKIIAAQAHAHLGETVRAIKMLAAVKLAVDMSQPSLLDMLLIQTAFAAGSPELLATPDAGKISLPVLNDALHTNLTEIQLLKIVQPQFKKSETYAAAVNVLLQRYLVSSRYGDFIALFDLAGKPKDFVSVETAVRSLLSKPKDPKALVNYGYFIQHNHMSPERAGSSCNQRFLGKIPSELTTEFKTSQDAAKAPLTYFMTASEQFKPEVRDDLEAKTLNFLVNCFKDSNDGYACRWFLGGDTFAPVEKRKEWFQTLKRKYPRSKWAKDLKFYY